MARDRPAAMWPFLRVRRYFLTGLRLQAIAMEAALDDRPGAARALNDLGDAYRFAGRWRR